MKKDSIAQRPEKLFREKYFMMYCVFLVAAIAFLYFIDIPSLHVLTTHPVLK
jgi:hypothetical protein